MSHMALTESAFDAALRFGLSSRETVIFLYLIHLTRKGDLCWPSLDTIAKKTGVHKSNVSRVLGKLDRLGLIRKERFSKAAVRRGQPSKQYRICCHSDNNLLSQRQELPTYTLLMNEKVESNDDGGRTPAMKPGRKDRTPKPVKSVAQIQAEIHENIMEETPEDVCAEYEALRSKLKAIGKDLGVEQMTDFWRRLVVATYPELTSYKALSEKQKQFLKHSFNDFGTYAIDFIRVIVKKWTRFCIDAGPLVLGKSGDKPKYPNVGLLALYRDVGPQLALKYLKEEEDQVQLIAQKPQKQYTVDKPAGHAKPSKAEIEKAKQEQLAYLESLGGTK